MAVSLSDKSDDIFWIICTTNNLIRRKKVQNNKNIFGQKWQWVPIIMSDEKLVRWKLQVRQFCPMRYTEFLSFLFYRDNSEFEEWEIKLMKASWISSSAPTIRRIIQAGFQY